MQFTETSLQGAFIVDLELREDERGFFARSWSAEEFSQQNLDPRLVQCSVSFSPRRGTLRGMHYQVAPFAEAKLVRCTRGSIFDVIIDLRPQSSTFRQWWGTELTLENRRAVFVPVGFAHGLQTLEDHTEVFYQMSERYHQGSAHGVRWNDPAFGIKWPIATPSVSETDANYPDFGR